MIYTVTLNPALDYVTRLDCFSKGGLNRCTSESLRAGGKGINVSVVLKNLGIESIVSGFTAGQTGILLEGMISDMGIKHDFVRIESGSTRINTKVICEGESSETEINGSGCAVSEDEKYELMKKLALLEKDDILVLAGSLPGGVSSTFYREITETVKTDKVILDTSGKALTEALAAKPFLIKPNAMELSEIIGSELKTADETVKGCFKLQKMGARNIFVSMGARGGLLVTEGGEIFFIDAPKGKVIYTVGAGDSAVAGFICGLESGRGMEYALKCGVAAGSATAFSEGLCDAASFQTVIKNM